MTADRYETSGVIRDGVLKLRHRARFDEAMRTMRDGEVIVSIRRSRATRSYEQNKLYWSLYVAPLSEYTGYSPLAIHSYLKKRFLEHQRIYIADHDGVVVDEAELEPTTTTLTKLEFSEYLHQVEAFAQTLGVTVGTREHEDESASHVSEADAAPH